MAKTGDAFFLECVRTAEDMRRRLPDGAVSVPKGEMHLVEWSRSPSVTCCHCGCMVTRPCRPGLGQECEACGDMHVFIEGGSV